MRLPPPEPLPSRNGPCPCGSGRKYKRCCWTKDVARAAGAPAGPAALLRLAHYTPRDRDRVLERLTRFAAREEFAEDVALAGDIFWGGPPEWASDEDFDALIDSDNGRMAFAPWLFFDFEIEPAETLADMFVAREGAALRPGERAYLDAVRTSVIRPWEIVGARVDDGFDLRDVETGTMVTVRERSASRQLVRWDVIAARVVTGGEGIPVIENVQGWFDQRVKHDIEKALRKARREQAKGPLAGNELAFNRRMAPLLNYVWVDHTALQPPPQLVTSTGESLALVRATFDVSDAEALCRALGERADMSSEDGRTFTWVRLPDRLVLGHFTLGARRLTFEAMAEARAERARELIAEIAPGAATYRLTRVEDLTASLAQKARSRGRPGARGLAKRGELPPEVQAEVTQQVLDRHYREWPDVPLPALGGRTPRHAAGLKSQRARVISLLKEFESHAARARLRGEPAYDTSWLWGALGFTDADRGASPPEGEADAH